MRLKAQLHFKNTTLNPHVQAPSNLVKRSGKRGVGRYGLMRPSLVLPLLLLGLLLLLLMPLLLLLATANTRAST